METKLNETGVSSKAEQTDSTSWFSGWWPFSSAESVAASGSIAAEQCTMTKPRVSVGFSQEYSVECDSGLKGKISQSWFPFLNSFKLDVKDKQSGETSTLAQSSRVFSLSGPSRFRVSGKNGETIAYISKKTEPLSGQSGKSSTVYTVLDANKNTIAKTPAIPYGQDSIKLKQGAKELASASQGWLSSRIPLLMPEYYSLELKSNNHLRPEVLLILQALHARHAAKQS